MKLLLISGGHQVELDDEDYARFRDTFWQPVVRGGRVTGVQRIKYLGGGKYNQQRKCLKLSREILGVSDPGLRVVFRDGNPLNQQRENLVVERMHSASETKAKRLLVTFESRFWSKVNKAGPTLREDLGPCWVWTAGHHTGGYGLISTPWPDGGGFAHRAAWRLKNGPIPEGFFICHRCDNPPCCKPDHLFLGTLQDNVADMMAKGRQSHAPRSPGELAHNATLTNAAAAEIRARLLAGEVGRRLAKEFGVSPTVISDINRGRTYRMVSTPQPAGGAS